MEQSVIATPLSRKDIRSYAFSIRRAFGFENETFFPIVHFIEFVLPQIHPGFVLDILDEEDMGRLHGKNCHALACPEKNLIYVREDIYYRAANGEGRDRFTMAHELGHFLMHKPGNVGLARIEKGDRIVSYRDPEWQANAFAGELLIPANLVRGMSELDIVNSCGVSYQAAQVQLRTF